MLPPLAAVALGAGVAARGLAAAVAPNGLLDLDREIGLFLDAGKGDDLRRNLARLDLPERGTAEAAALIKGLTP